MNVDLANKDLRDAISGVLDKHFGHLVGTQCSDGTVTRVFVDRDGFFMAAVSGASGNRNVPISLLSLS